MPCQHVTRDLGENEEQICKATRVRTIVVLELPVVGLLVFRTNPDPDIRSHQSARGVEALRVPPVSVALGLGRHAFVGIFAAGIFLLQLSELLVGQIVGVDLKAIVFWVAGAKGTADRAGGAWMSLPSSVATPAVPTAVLVAATSTEAASPAAVPSAVPIAPFIPTPRVLPSSVAVVLSRTAVEISSVARAPFLARVAVSSTAVPPVVSAARPTPVVGARHAVSRRAVLPPAVSIATPLPTARTPLVVPVPAAMVVVIAATAATSVVSAVLVVAMTRGWAIARATARVAVLQLAGRGERSVHLFCFVA